MHPAKGERRRENYDVVFVQDVHRFFEGVETNEPAVFGNFHLARLAREVVGDGPVAVAQTVLEHIGHRHQFGFRIRHREGIGCRSRSAAPAAHERHLQGLIAIRRIHRRQRKGGERGSGTSGLQKLSAALLTDCVFVHHGFWSFA